MDYIPCDTGVGEVRVEDVWVTSKSTDKIVTSDLYSNRHPYVPRGRGFRVSEESSIQSHLSRRYTLPLVPSTYNG